MPMPHRARASALTATAVLLSCQLTGCADDDSAHEGDLPTQELTWQDCPAPSPAQGEGGSPSPLPADGTWQCATMKAPRDWNRPDGDTIGIELIRVRSSGGENRRMGSLLFNFGGPGGSGVATLPAFGEGYEKLRTRYDLVSFDPRGVGRSSPVRCVDDQRLDAHLQQDSTPDDAAERAELVDSTKEFNGACEKNSAKILPYMRTTDVARDMELMRQVLGDDKLHYFGISYGTELGAVYAHLFPEKVGHAILDAVVDPTRNSEQGSLAQARGFQRALDDFAADCAARAEDCPIGDTAHQVKERIAKLLEDLDSEPIDGIFPRRLSQSAATNGIAQALYSKDYWPYLAQGLEEAYDGDGRTLMLLSDALNGRGENGEYSNITAANVAVNCADDKLRYDTGDVRRRLPAFRSASNLFGEFLAWSLLSCTDWAVPGAAEHPEVGPAGAGPILVVGNTGDPATPYEGARRMARALGKGVGVQLTYRGQGHGAYDSGSTCVQDAVNGYLLHHRVVEDGTVCS